MSGYAMKPLTRPTSNHLSADMIWYGIGPPKVKIGRMIIRPYGVKEAKGCIRTL
jgi:hypothetical protein